MESTAKTWRDCIKVSILTGVVLVSFIMSSLGWHRIECSETVKISVAAIILIFMYTLMIFELVHRTLAALIGAVMAIAAYDCMVGFATMEEIIQWEDLETLSLLFGMMIIVNVLSSSGLFDYLAVWSYEKAAGRFWTLITFITLITSILSALIDNVSTMLLMSPTLIKLSELEHVDPRYVLTIAVIMSGIGGCSTPVGDPPNLIIFNDPLVSKLGITFTGFTALCTPCVLLTMASILLYLKLFYKSKESFRIGQNDGGGSSEITLFELKKTQSIPMIKRHMLSELEVLNNLTDQLESLNKNLTQESSLLKQNIKSQANQLKLRINEPSSEEDLDLKAEFVVNHEDARKGSRLDKEQINELMRVHSIKSRTILYQSLSVLFITVLLFFIQSLPGTNLTLGWISLFAGLSLLVLSSANKSRTESEEEQQEDPFDVVINNIEYSTLLFFFSLFIVMSVMDKLGLILYIGNHITQLINFIPAGNMRSIGAISIILWASAIASACIDNVPFTSMMIKVLATLIIQSRSEVGALETQPLVYALAFGCNYGGNATLIGASANLVTAGVAARHKYPISFKWFFKFAAPITLIAMVVANVYLIAAFVLIKI